MRRTQEVILPYGNRGEYGPIRWFVAEACHEVFFVTWRGRRNSSGGSNRRL